MPITYVNIQSITLSTSAMSVTFTSIPQTFTDLAVHVSARADATGTYRNLNGFVNALGTNAWTTMVGSRNSSSSQINSGLLFNAGLVTAASATTSTFGNSFLYFPSYRNNANKQMYAIGAPENNSQDFNIQQTAVAITDPTTAVTSLTFNLNNGADPFATGSTFYLYGIKND